MEWAWTGGSWAGREGGVLRGRGEEGRGREGGVYGMYRVYWNMSNEKRKEE